MAYSRHGGSGFTVEVEREEDGRWIAEVPALPGVMTYGLTREDAMARVEALALRVLADRPSTATAVPDRNATDDLLAADEHRALRESRGV